MLHGEKSTTPAGNPRKPSIETYLTWIADAWDSIPNDLIANSFKSCGIINELDGSEDDKIHCFKEHGSIPTGFARLKKARQDESDKNTAKLLEEIDLEQDLENGYDVEDLID